MRLFSIVMSAVSGLVLLSDVAKSDDGAVRASCTQAGRIIYREDLPSGTPANRRLEIAAANPNALCIFLKAEPVEANVPEVNDAVLANVSGGGSEDLAAALSFLSPGGAVGTPYGKVFDESMTSFMKTENAFTKDIKSVNLTIGVYSGATPEDVLAHWGAIIKNAKLLGRMTPSIERIGDVTVLSVENVADEDASIVCEEAQQYASGCVAVY